MKPIFDATKAWEQHVLSVATSQKARGGAPAKWGTVGYLRDKLEFYPPETPLQFAVAPRRALEVASVYWDDAGVGTRLWIDLEDWEPETDPK